MDWQQYEDEIYQHFREQYPKAKISRNVKVKGRISKVNRQIDILIDDTLADFSIRIVIDAKHRTRRIDVTDVEAFISFCKDVGANKGVMVSLKGYTKAAAVRVHGDESDIELDVLPFADLKRFQAFGALAHGGGHGVALPAPFGWVVDASRPAGLIAALYQRGYDFESATRAKEWMYVNFWIKNVDAIDTLGKLLTHQASYMLDKHPNAELSYLEGPSRRNGVTRIRRFSEASYPSLEITGFVDFDDFIFMCVLFTPEEFEKRNLRKLYSILRTVVPFSVHHV